MLFIMSLIILLLIILLLFLIVTADIDHKPPNSYA